MNDTVNPSLVPQQLAVEVQIGEGANCRIVLIPVKDSAESLHVQKRINQTPGKLIFAGDSDNPMTIHCGRVLFMQTVIVPPKATMPTSRLAKLSQ